MAGYLTQADAQALIAQRLQAYAETLLSRFQSGELRQEPDKDELGDLLEHLHGRISDLRDQHRANRPRR